MHTLQSRKLPALVILQPASLKASRSSVRTPPTHILILREIMLLVIYYNFFSILFIDINSSASLQSESVFINVINPFASIELYLTSKVKVMVICLNISFLTWFFSFFTHIWKKKLSYL